MPEFSLSTKENQEIIDITSQVSDIVKQSELKEGLCLIYTLHTTAAIIVNENWDPNICSDLLNSLFRMVPKRAGYKHDEVDGNAHAHIKSSIVGPSETLTFKDGRLFLGRWQAVMFCEFDGPRPNRRVVVELIGK